MMRGYDEDGWGRPVWIGDYMRESPTIAQIDEGLRQLAARCAAGQHSTQRIQDEHGERCAACNGLIHP